MTRFRALEISYQVIRSLRATVNVVRRRSDRLARQIETAASSVSLNLGEGSRRLGKDRLHHFRIAAGSADEVRCGLRVAEAWGYVEEADVAESLQLLDTLLAMLFALSRGRKMATRVD